MKSLVVGRFRMVYCTGTFLDLELLCAQKHFPCSFKSEITIQLLQNVYRLKVGIHIFYE